MGKARIEWLDLFRGIAAIFVVGYHYRYYLGMSRLSFGFVAVDLFFILSGIVLGQRYTSAIEGGMPFLKFAGARLRRLYPMAFIAGVFVVSMNVLGVPTGFMVASADYAAWTLFTLIPALGSFGPTPFPPDGPVWSLWAELVTNAIWFFVVRAGRTAMAAVGIAAVAATVLVAILNHGLDFGFGPGPLPLVGAVTRAMAGFSVGVLIALRPWRRISSPLLLLALLACVFIAYPFYPTWWCSVASVAVGALLLAELARSNPPPSWLSAPSRLVGMASFPLYLMHAPAGRLLPYVPGHVPHWLALLLVVGIPTVVATAANESVVGYLQKTFGSRQEAKPAPTTL